jgi:hypothetical protein
MRRPRPTVGVGGGGGEGVAGRGVEIINFLALAEDIIRLNFNWHNRRM